MAPSGSSRPPLRHIRAHRSASNSPVRAAPRPCSARHWKRAGTVGTCRSWRRMVHQEEPAPIRWPSRTTITSASGGISFTQSMAAANPGSTAKRHCVFTGLSMRCSPALPQAPSFISNMTKREHRKQPAPFPPMHTIVILNPGHFHAALTLRERHPLIGDDVHVFAEDGPDVDNFLRLVQSFNDRAVDPTRWTLYVYRGPDYLERLIAQRPG